MFILVRCVSSCASCFLGEEEGGENILYNMRKHIFSKHICTNNVDVFRFSLLFCLLGISKFVRLWDFRRDAIWELCTCKLPKKRSMCISKCEKFVYM